MLKVRKPPVRELAAAVMLGVGGVLQRKADPTEHWSTSPRVTVATEVADESSGDPAIGSESDRPPTESMRNRKRRRRWWHRWLEMES